MKEIIVYKCRYYNECHYDIKENLRIDGSVEIEIDTKIIDHCPHTDEFGEYWICKKWKEE